MANASEVKEDILNVTGHKKERNAKSRKGGKLCYKIYFLKNHEKKREKNLKIK